MVYSAGDLVEASYSDIQGGKSTSVFVVLYNEALDAETRHNRNLTVLKVTTNEKNYDRYSFTLNPVRYTLPRKSIVKANKVNTIDVSNIFRHHGALTHRDWNLVKQRYDMYQDEVARQAKIKI